VKKLVVVAATAGMGLMGLGTTVAHASTDTAFHPASIKWHQCSASFVQSIVAAGYDKVDPQHPVSKVIQCAELKVPLDYSRPHGQKITLALSRAPHLGKGRAKGDIVVNPGGPGGGGQLFGARVWAQNSAAMKAAYNVIGFDPRGVGASQPSLSCDEHFNDAVRPAYGTGQKKSDDVWLARSRAYAQACAKKYGRGSKVDLLDHIKTIDSVRDIDTIRAAAGDRKLDYYGASYGTYLGQVYATVFPKHVGHMVLDGNVDSKRIWYTTQLDQDIAFNKNLDYYFGWLARWDSVYHLGKTPQAVRAFYYDTLAKVTKHPVYYTDPATKSTSAVGPDELTDTIQNAGYRRSQAVWNNYGTGLAAYAKGDKAGFVGAFGAPTKDPVSDNEFAVYNAVQCTDTQWPTSFAKWRSDAVQVNRKAPFETWGNVWFNAPCLFWGAKAGTPVKIGATKDLPKNILMFNATDDAATPYQGALETHKILRGSHLVVQDGDRTHCIVHRGDPQVDAYYDAYFLSGKLPAQYTVHVPQLGDPTPPTGA
jgi:pimeloyl-ACP methyl ester carboxylesterase